MGYEYFILLFIFGVKCANIPFFTSDPAAYSEPRPSWTSVTLTMTISETSYVLCGAVVGYNSQQLTTTSIRSSSIIGNATCTAGSTCFLALNSLLPGTGYSIFCFGSAGGVDGTVSNRLQWTALKYIQWQYNPTPGVIMDESVELIAISDTPSYLLCVAYPGGSPDPGRYVNLFESTQPKAQAYCTPGNTCLVKITGLTASKLYGFYCGWSDSSSGAFSATAESTMRGPIQVTTTLTFPTPQWVQYPRENKAVSPTTSSIGLRFQTDIDSTVVCAAFTSYPNVPPGLSDIQAATKKSSVTCLARQWCTTNIVGLQTLNYYYLYCVAYTIHQVGVVTSYMYRKTQPPAPTFVPIQPPLPTDYPPPPFVTAPTVSYYDHQSVVLKSKLSSNGYVWCGLTTALSPLLQTIDSKAQWNGWSRCRAYEDCTIQIKSLASATTYNLYCYSSYYYLPALGGSDITTRLQFTTLPNLCTGVGCPGASNCYWSGVCNPLTGACDANPKWVGYYCDDKNALTEIDRCTSDGRCLVSKPAKFVGKLNLYSMRAYSLFVSVRVDINSTGVRCGAWLQDTVPNLITPAMIRTTYNTYKLCSNDTDCIMEIKGLTPAFGYEVHCATEEGTYAVMHEDYIRTVTLTYPSRFIDNPTCIAFSENILAVKFNAETYSNNNNRPLCAAVGVNDPAPSDGFSISSLPTASYSSCDPTALCTIYVENLSQNTNYSVYCAASVESPVVKLSCGIPIDTNPPKWLNGPDISVAVAEASVVVKATLSEDAEVSCVVGSYNRSYYPTPSQVRSLVMSDDFIEIWGNGTNTGKVCTKGVECRINVDIPSIKSGYYYVYCTAEDLNFNLMTTVARLPLHIVNFVEDPPLYISYDRMKTTIKGTLTENGTLSCWLQNTVTNTADAAAVSYCQNCFLELYTGALNDGEYYLMCRVLGLADNTVIPWSISLCDICSGRTGDPDECQWWRSLPEENRLLVKPFFVPPAEYSPPSKNFPPISNAITGSIIPSVGSTPKVYLRSRC